MKGGTQLYDIIVLIGVVMLIFVIIYWSVTYGAQMVANMLFSSPQAVQDSMANFMGSSCISGNMTIMLSITPTPLTLVVDRETVNAVPPDYPYYGGREVERGGYVRFGAPDPIPYVWCTDSSIERGSFEFDPRQNIFFVVNKTMEDVSIGVE